MDRRFYVTTLPFAHDLCQAINSGINNPLPAAPNEPGTEAMDVSPTKYSTHSESGARKRLGKRILKLLQPYLEAALKAEADICGKPFDLLQKELEGMLEASLETRQLPISSIMVSRDRDTAPDQDQDVDMADAPEEGQIIVAEHSEGEEDAEGELDDAMDGAHTGDDNIDVGGYDEHGEPTPKPNGAFSSANSLSGDLVPPPKESTPHLTNGFTKPSSASPPSLPDGSYHHHHHHNHNLTDPLTPPQSNTSNSGAPSFTAAPNPSLPTTLKTTTTSTSLLPNPTTHTTTTPLTTTTTTTTTTTKNPLTEGGLPWYLASFELDGTTAAQEQWPTPAAAAAPHSHSHHSQSHSHSSPSEDELTDLDEETLRDLEFDVDEENSIVIGAGAGSPGHEYHTHSHSHSHHQSGGSGRRGSGGGGVVGRKGEGNGAGSGSGSGSVGGGSPRKRTRSEVAAAGVAVGGGRLLRRGVRSSARRR